MCEQTIGQIVEELTGRIDDLEERIEQLEADHRAPLNNDPIDEFDPDRWGVESGRMDYYGSLD